MSDQHTESRSLVISRWPDGKLPILGVQEGSVITILARFVNDKAVETFWELAQRGIQAQEEEEEEELLEEVSGE